MAYKASGRVVRSLSTVSLFSHSLKLASLPS